MPGTHFGNLSTINSLERIYQPRESHRASRHVNVRCRKLHIDRDRPS
jgi:hypothetical protein